jgi:hypothetical protein
LFGTKHHDKIKHNPEELLQTQKKYIAGTKQSNILIESVANDNQKLAHTILKSKTIQTAVAMSIPKEIKDFITGVSFKTDGPITLQELSYLIIVHWGFDDKLHLGEMIVNKKIADKVVDIFTELCYEKYPIEKIRLIDEYNADDNKSMEDNNSSALCVRKKVGMEEYSNHSYGTAIDINPLQNPYVSLKNSLVILPKISEKYANRTIDETGMITKNDACYNAFVKRGFTWGGECWAEQHNTMDYQHFEIALD